MSVECEAAGGQSQTQAGAVGVARRDSEFELFPSSFELICETGTSTASSSSSRIESSPSRPAPMPTFYNPPDLSSSDVAEAPRANSEHNASEDLIATRFVDVVPQLFRNMAPGVVCVNIPHTHMYTCQWYIRVQCNKLVTISHSLIYNSVYLGELSLFQCILLQSPLG